MSRPFKATIFAVLTVTLFGGMIYATNHVDHIGLVQIRATTARTGINIYEGIVAEWDVINFGPGADTLDFGEELGVIRFHGEQAPEDLEAITRRTNAPAPYTWLEDTDETNDMIEVRGDEVEIVSNYGDVVIVLGGSL